MKTRVSVLLVGLLIAVGSLGIVGCAGSTAPDKMGDGKMSTEKMDGDKMGDDKMADEKMSDEKMK